MKKLGFLLLHLLIAFLSPYAWLSMVLRSSGGLLTATGLASLKYFTVLSNLLSGLASLILVLSRLLKKDAPWIHRLHYAAAVSVGLTFLTVIAFLGPLYGYEAMFEGSNLWLHLVLPLAAEAAFILFNPMPMTRRDNALAVLPMLLYGVGYVGNILANGRDANDWYSFLAWGYPAGVAIFLLILAVTFGLGLLLRKANVRQ